MNLKTLYTPEIVLDSSKPKCAPNLKASQIVVDIKYAIIFFFFKYESWRKPYLQIHMKSSDAFQNSQAQYVEERQ